MLPDTGWKFVGLKALLQKMTAVAVLTHIHVVVNCKLRISTNLKIAY